MTLSKNNNRIGLFLIAAILSLYTIALCASIWHLPSPIHRRRRWVERMKLRFGGRINLSTTGIEDVADAEDAEDYDDALQEGNISGVIPEAKWPISIRDEDGNFDDVVHPGHKAKGNPDVIMSVPKFWIDNPVSIHQNKLMTRGLAMKIGSCATSDANGNHARGDSCPVSERTIYVAIASYRDYQCRDTVTSIFERAKFPERVRVGVVDQIVDGEDGPCDAPYEPCSVNPEQMLCKYKSQLDVYQVDAPLAIGPVFARHLGHRMYRGEYYYMQSDAHVTFTRNWDVDIISQQEATKNEMAVLSTYLSDVVGNIDKNGKSLINTRPIMCNTDYESGQKNKYLRHGSQPEAVPTIRGTPQLEPYWAAGYSFSRGHFVVNVPYDFYQPMIFQGEEMSIGIRGFSIGYDFYAPERSVCFHHYAEGKNKKARNKVPHYWEHTNIYAGAGTKAMYRLLGVVHMNPEIDRNEWDHTEESKYGLGGVRTPEQFYSTFGIDVLHKRTEQHLCRFVETGLMHKNFTPFLRKDGMGIDYSAEAIASFKFKDPLNGEKGSEDVDDENEEEEEEE
eukprot:CAMPEP_0201690236 /NCGR_PEP_ID=MMETSP0578-20130828/3704_1 /ASSEMBLY_ACC=CAM_ASM_000663 /TAXON_ID=267565 /ORGANISM="Skeletonema grethea, Strain CCMP 1804" /LENGTH=561 /DNA_ID=CAMNT_0048175155 /DNA_START=138 /DNA_END=1823 /DNA_ORIENTATION=+